MNDKNTTISELIDKLVKFRDERGWLKYHLPRNLATSIVLESSELLEHFQWDLKMLTSSVIKKDPEKLLEIKKELADVLIYSFELAAILKLDVTESIGMKMEHNAKKYSTKYFNKNDQNLKHYKKIKALYRSGKK